MIQKKLLFSTIITLTSLATSLPVHAEYIYNGKHWNKTTLRYYISHNTTQMSPISRQTAIGNAFATWSSATVFRFEEVNSDSDADIILQWKTGSHSGCAEAFDGYEGILAHTGFSSTTGQAHIHFDDGICQV